MLNILALPGLGSLLAGRRVAGAGQLGLAAAGSTLLVVWLFKLLTQYYDLMFEDVHPQPVGWIGLTGGILFVISWLWAMVTSISLFREASLQETQTFKKSSAPQMKLSESEITLALASVPDWKLNAATIVRTYQFKDFPAAVKFVDAVAALAEQAWHHPDIDIRWNKVTLTLSTHDAGGLTEKDFALARQFDKL